MSTVFFEIKPKKYVKWKLLHDTGLF